MSERLQYIRAEPNAIGWTLIIQLAGGGAEVFIRNEYSPEEIAHELEQLGRMVAFGANMRRETKNAP